MVAGTGSQPRVHRIALPLIAFDHKFPNSAGAVAAVVKTKSRHMVIERLFFKCFNTQCIIKLCNMQTVQWINVLYTSISTLSIQKLFTDDDHKWI